MKLSLAAAALLAASLNSAHATTLFYNGDPDGGGINGNFLDCSTCRATGGVKVYDDFQVSPGGWQVNGLFGYMYTMQPSAPSTPWPTSAAWEIRQGLAQGNSGTLVASGSAPVTITPISTPPNGSSSVYYFKVQVSITTLNLAQGTYWMTLAPDSASNEPFLIGTAGANGVSAVIDGTSYVTGPYWTGMQNIGSYLQPFTGHSSYDFSYGVVGESATPESASWTLSLTGLGLIGLRLRGGANRRLNANLRLKG